MKKTNKRLKLALLDLYDNTPNQGMRAIKEILDRFEDQMEYKVFDVRALGEIPDLSYDIYLGTGGPGSPLDGDGHWDRRLFEWMDAVWQWNLEGKFPPKYVFFICHSFQMACHHFGVGTLTERNVRSFGTFPVHKTQEGKRDWLFQNLPDPFWIADFRDWQVIRPNHKNIEEHGYRILALEQIRPAFPLKRAIMAVRFSDTMFGTQFHPEADPEGMYDHFNKAEKREEIIEEHGEEVFESMMHDLQHPTRIPLTHDQILPRFLQNAIGKIKAMYAKAERMRGEA